MQARRARSRRAAAWGSLLVAALAPRALPQAGFAERQIAAGLNSPVSMAIAPDGRVFIAQQGGALVVVKNDALLATPFVTVPTTADDEEGLLGVAFDPAFATNHFVYVCYTAATPTRHDRIVRYTADGDVALAGSATVLYDLDDNVAHYHVGGALRFGVDGKLYLSTGDNADGLNAPNLASTFGKLLRIDANGTIPADNPFFAATTGRYRAIWAFGFRNAFTFDVQPVTGRIFVNDIGSFRFEEVDDVVRGGDYGWPDFEGPFSGPTWFAPVHSYDHSHGCAITGGAFYNPPVAQFPPQYVGKFFYGEYCADEIRCLDPAAPATWTVFRPTIAPGIVDLRVGPDGALWYLVRGDSNSSGGNNIFTGRLVKVLYAPAGLTILGPGCAGSLGVPTLGAVGVPRVGSAGFAISVGNLAANALVALELGLGGGQSWAGPLPLDLGVYGLPGCFLYTSAEVSLLQVRGASATVTFPQPIPNDAALLGMHIFVEGFVVDPGANPAGVVTTPGADVLIGV